MGGGNSVESVRSVPSNNTQEIQAYHQELQDYNNAIAKLKANQAQTITQLKALAQQLQSLNPNSIALNTLLAKIQSYIANPSGDLSQITTSVTDYQNYLNKILTDYQDANQNLVNQAQSALKKYQQALSHSTSQNQVILQNAIKTFDSYNTQIAQVAKELGIPYTPLALPPILQGNISSLTPAQVSQAIATLSGDISHMISVVSGDIQGLSKANQKIAIENANKLSTLTNDKTTAISQALSQITGLTQIVGRAFHNQWVRYADGKTFFLNNGTTGKSFINAGDTCVFDIIINNQASSINNCGYEGGTTSLLAKFQKATAKYGFTPKRFGIPSLM
ncbi:hypothetical protein [Helicobacter labacensis]|uniref:hypothetical protein n=1 Tax=Helicobacter labacensis TaxID=2316079 RepID=UPI000EAD086A|nr:hypothetical protein [Helicobacter labacensis]